MNKLWPPLFKKTSTGALQRWQIEVKGDQVISVWGQDGGAQQTTSDTAAPKNVGKTNETTPEAQAVLEAQALFDKKLKSGYVREPDDAMAGKKDAIIKGGIDVMLAHRYEDHVKKVTWPAIIDPKLDGERCVAIVKDGKCTLWSRTRKQVHSMPHIVAAVESLGENDLVLDGELYNHDAKMGKGDITFQKLMSLTRAKEPQPGHEQVQYHVYDSPHETAIALDRKAYVSSVIPLGHPILHAVPVAVVSDEAQAFELFRLFLSQKYEGAILRNSNAKYVGKRSHDLLKIKEFVTGDFPIVDFYEGKGKHQGSLGGVVVRHPAHGEGAGITTEVGSGFSDAERADIWLNRESYLGRIVEVQFFEYTDAGLLRFPTFVRHRPDKE